MIIVASYYLCLMARATSAFVAYPPQVPTLRAASLLRTTSKQMVSLLTTSTSSTGKDSSTNPTIPKVETVDALPENLPASLNNAYFFLRHGLSTANVASIISSNRTALAYTDMHGVTETGYRQGVASADQLLDLIPSNGIDSVVFVSSPFARARQTAAACLEGLLEKKHDEMEVDETIYLHPNLMERSFGRLDGEAIETYAYVWPLDAFNVTHTAFDVESVAAVCHRFRQCILELEDTFTQKHIVLVSHADVLQIAQLYAAGADNVGTFSSYRFKST